MSSKLVIGNVNLFPYTGSAAIEGDLTVSGILTAKEHHNIIVSSSISYVSGSHKFGDSADDLHQVTGSMMVTGTLSGTIVSGTFYGDGSNLTGVGGGGGTPGGLNTQVQYNDASSFGGSANFTFDGTAITVAGITGSNGAYFADKVGIGTSAPVADLHISGASGVDAFRVDTVGALDNPAIFVDGTNSYVGIGTASPAQGLHVKDNGGGQIVSRIEGSAGRAVLQMDNGANYAFFGASTSGLDFAAGGAGAYSAPLATLKSNGNFGIGVTDPDTTLEVLNTTTQQKWSYDADSYVTMTVADDSHATIASGESGDITIDAATLYVTGSTQHLGGVNGQEVSLGSIADGGTVDWDASLGEYAHVLAAGSLDVKIINMSASMTLNLIIENDSMAAGAYTITLSGSTDGTGTNGSSATYANGVTSLMMIDTDNYLSVELASFSVGLFQIGSNFYV